MGWFSRRRKRRRYGQVAEMFAVLREADAQQRAGVATDPEHQAYIAHIRAQLAQARAPRRPGGYPR